MTATVAEGKPVVVIANVPAAPTLKLNALALVIAGAWFTVSVNACAIGVPTPFEAEMLKG